MNMYNEDNEEQQEEDLDNDYFFSQIANIINNNAFVEEHDADLDPIVDIDNDQLGEYSDEYDDLHEIFRIHTSNLEAYSSNQIPDRYLLHDNGIFTNTVRSYYNNHSCPICELNGMSTEQLGNHLIYNHSRLFVSLASTLYPNSTAQDIQNLFSGVQSSISYTSNLESLYDYGLYDRDESIRQVMHRLVFNNDDTDESPSYEDLLNLCEYIGYYKQGIVDIEKVTEKKKTKEEESIKKDDTCIVCLDLLSSKEEVRKINICGHVFCPECIEKWFEENKVCPLCKTELDVINI